LFAVRFQSDAKEWCVVKQLGDFNLLLNALRLTSTDCKLKLPTKNMFDPSFGRKRLKQLKAFINELITDPQYLAQDCVKKFLGLDQLCPPGLPLTAQVDMETTEAKRAIPEDFVLVKKIGMGAFGQVYLANSRTTNGVFAIKVLKKKQQIERPSGVQQVMSERNVLIKSLQHPFLCKLRYTFQSASMLFFVMDYVNGGELYSYIQRERFTEERAKFYVAEIACALGYLHSEKIIYRDLKPENILLDGQGHIVLTDFGLCTNADGAQETGTVCGTPEYLAPESIRAGEYSYAVDWWGLGTVFYEMLYGLPPFFDTNRRKMHEAILTRPVKLGDNISEEAKQILLGLLHKSKEERLGSRLDFEEIRSHCFFRKMDWAALLARRIRPPFTPLVSSLADTRHVAPEFTCLPISVACRMNLTLSLIFSPQHLSLIQSNALDDPTPPSLWMTHSLGSLTTPLPFWENEYTTLVSVYILMLEPSAYGAVLDPFFGFGADRIPSTAFLLPGSLLIRLEEYYLDSNQESGPSWNNENKLSGL
ncbi:kinase domain protein, partial [Opisthorchis viverrini]